MTLAAHRFISLRSGLCLAALMLFFFSLALPARAAESTILTGKVAATVSRPATMPYPGVVEEVLVRPGDAVAKDSPLLRYHLQEETERNLQREVANGPGTEGQKGQVLDMERKLAEISAERNKARQLAASGLGSRQALARLEDDVVSLKQRIELSRVSIRKAEDNFASRLKELGRYFGVPIKEGALLPSSLVLTSPIGGYVLALSQDVEIGALLGGGAAPVLVGQINPVLIQVPVYEAEVSQIKVGDTAQVEIPSLGNKKYTASVNEIAWASNDMNVGNPSYYTVQLTVPNPDLELKPGFKVIVRFSGSGKPAS